MLFMCSTRQKVAFEKFLGHAPNAGTKKPINGSQVSQANMQVLGVSELWSITNARIVHTHGARAVRTMLRSQSKRP
jgi:hypothetical protein